MGRPLAIMLSEMAQQGCFTNNNQTFETVWTSPLIYSVPEMLKLRLPNLTVSLLKVEPIWHVAMQQGRVVK